MSDIDFKKEALEFAIQNGCPPACLIEKAMRHAASLVVNAVSDDIKGVRASLAKERAGNISNGDTKVISTP